MLRDPTMTVAVISPHLDDAILSFGGVLAAPYAATVITVFAGIPPSWSWPSPFDSASGFDDSATAVFERRQEDKRACRALGVTPKHLPFLDGQYGIPNDFDAIVTEIAERLPLFTDVAMPLGLAHPDHRLVAKACRAALHRYPGRRFVVYADLPSYKLWPSHVPGALRGWERAGFPLAPHDLPRDLDAKRKAYECYTSQLGFPELAWENLTEEQTWIVP